MAERELSERTASHPVKRQVHHMELRTASGPSRSGCRRLEVV